MSERSAAGRTPGYGWLAAETAVVFVAYFAFHLWSELKFEGFVGSDGYYHIKLAYLYRTGECSILGGDFPWTQFSSFHRLRHDWQLGYHLLLIPFTLLGLVTGAKVSTACFAALLFAVLYLILRLHRVRFAWLFWLIAVFASSSMALRYHAPRPTPLLVSLFLLYVHFHRAATVRGRERRGRSSRCSCTTSRTAWRWPAASPSCCSPSTTARCPGGSGARLPPAWRSGSCCTRGSGTGRATG